MQVVVNWHEQHRPGETFGIRAIPAIAESFTSHICDVIEVLGGVDPATGLIAPDTEAQTEQVLKNIQAILEAAGSSLQHVLRCGVFLLDMNEFAKMNAVYARMFGDHRPARTTVQVAGLPGEGLRVEIDAVAYKP